MSEDKGLYPSIQQLSGATLTSVNHVGDVIDQDFLRLAREEGVVLPTAGDTEREKYHGAIVGMPVAGRHEHVAYADLAAMYPNIMRSLNLSPETIIGYDDDLEDSEYTENETVWGYVDPRPVKWLSEDEMYRNFTGGSYKMVYDPNQNTIKWRDDWDRIQDNLVRCYCIHPDVQRGFIASRVNDYTVWNKEYEGVMYDATKQVRNGTYGVTGDSNFRLFDWRIAESVTIAGRLILDYTREQMVDRFQSHADVGDVYTAVADTDGFGLCCPEIGTRGHMMEYVTQTADWLNETGYDQFMTETFGVDEHWMEVEIEAYAPTLFVPGDDDGATKKTYSKWVTIEDGDECDENEHTGWECERSDVADITVEVQKQILDWILREDIGTAKELTYEYLRDVHEQVMNGNRTLAELGKRSGLSKDPSEYGTPERTPQPIYRGAKYAKQFIDGEDEFEKPRAFYVDSIGCDDHPPIFQSETAEDGTPVDVISVEDPSNIPECCSIDRQKHWEKTVVQPMRQILQTMGWSMTDALSQHEQASFSEFA